MAADNSHLVWLDLCSGLGGASQPALDRGWKVIRVDIDPRFKPDIVADVRALPLRPFHVDVLWASPPCQDFSKWGMRCFYPNPKEPDISIALAVRQFIADLSPAWWVIENVWAARRWFGQIFGPLRAKIPGHAFWGRLPGLLPVVQAHKGGRRAFAHLRKRGIKFDEKHRHYVHDGPHGRSFIPYMRHAPAEAAKIPYEIGEAICRAVEQRRAG